MIVEVTLSSNLGMRTSKNNPQIITYLQPRYTRMHKHEIAAKNRTKVKIRGN